MLFRVPGMYILYICDIPRWYISWFKGLKNSRCDVNSHQLETPKTSKTSCLKKMYFPMFSRYVYLFVLWHIIYFSICMPIASRTHKFVGFFFPKTNGFSLKKNPGKTQCFCPKKVTVSSGYRTRIFQAYKTRWTDYFAPFSR